MLYRFEDFVLDINRRELRRGDSLIAIEPQVFDLLVFLIRTRERVVSRDDLSLPRFGKDASSRKRHSIAG